MADTDTSDEESGDDSEESKKKSKLPLILAAAGVLILFAGGAAAWFLVLAPGDDTVAEVVEEPLPPPPPAPGFVNVEWLVIQTPGEHKPFRDLSFLVMLEVDGEGFDNVAVAQEMPKLRDAFLVALTEPALVDSPTGRVDAVEVKTRLQDAADHVLGEGLVKDVLIQAIQDTAA